VTANPPTAVKTELNRTLHLALLVAGCLLAYPRGGSAAESLTGEQALQKLMEGNRRFATGAAAHPNQSSERRAEVVKGQHPFAIVLTCADSRVSPEVLFDQGLGDLFVLRNAGNVLDDHTIGSIEYAVEHLHAPLIVVLGHSQCGAVSATVAGGHAPGHIASVVAAIEPALERTKGQAGDQVDNTVRANALRATEILSRVEPIVNEAVKSGKVKIVAARYDLASAQVELLK
jgi:carbonic anhydrase